MSWGFLTKFLEEIHKHSTFVGKIWLTMFIILRIVVTAVVGESIYYDEQSKFTCNTMQPGCKNVCYNQFAPLSYVRFWAFQIVMVATPPVLYLGYAVDRVARLKGRQDGGHYGGQDQTVEEGRKWREKHKDKWKSKVQHSCWEQIYHDGLMSAYMLQLIIRFGLECGFLVLQFFLYGLAVPSIYVCSVKPCPHNVDCFISRSTERTIFLIFTYIVILLGLLLNMWEMVHLGISTVLDIFRSKLCSRSKGADPLSPSSCSFGSLSALEAVEMDDSVNGYRCFPFNHAAPSFAIVMEEEPELISKSAVDARIEHRHNDLASPSQRRDQELREAKRTPKTTVKIYKQRWKKCRSRTIERGSKSRPAKNNGGLCV